MTTEPPIAEVGQLPSQLPVLPLKGTVVFPGAMAPLSIGEERSIRLIDDVVDGASRLVVLVTSRNPDVPEPGPELLHDVGTVAVVQRMLKVPDGTLRILAQGTERVRVGPYSSTTPYLIAQIEPMPELDQTSKQIVALARNIQGIFSRIIDLVPYLPDELELAVANIDDPSLLSYIVEIGRASCRERV